MFEDGFDEEVRAAVAAGDLLLDAPSSRDELWDALTEEELAWLREQPLPAPVRDILTAGQQQPVTAHLVARLEMIDPASLDGNGRIACAAAWQRVANAAMARRAEAVAAVAESQESTDWADSVRAAATELAAALALGMGAADLLTGTSVLLVARLRQTLAAAQRGDLSWDKVVSLAHATAPLSDEQACAVEARVLPRAAGRTPQQHRDAVRRAVDRIDPEGVRRRRDQAQADIRLIATHQGSGMGELFAALPSEQLETIWTAADCHARAAKAAGDPRTLDQLRVAALVAWAESYLTHGDPVACADVRAQSHASSERPTHHGRPVAVRVLWDLSSLVGVTSHCGELSASGAPLPPQAMRELLARGARVRRMLIDDNGELVDLTPCTWVLPPTGSAESRPATGTAESRPAMGSAESQPTADSADTHLPPIQLGLIVDVQTRDALRSGDFSRLAGRRRRIARQLAELLPLTEPALAELLDFPITADSLDDDPGAARPSAALAEFVAVRDRHPVNPSAGPTDAAAADVDHTIPRSAGGRTVRDNLASLTRRWHIARTHGGWSYRRVGRSWEWTSPSGLTFTTSPYDYRLGP
ncbi:MAG TPA: DUF222 domain-containing protein [Mycobacteriales bacterium]|nr:DUF222 domain-containing protein [Mycobacteriales bacterium]